MNKIIVSLVSDQTIPNIIFIKSNHDVAKLVFISTEKMESNKKTEWIQKSVKIGMYNCKIKIETIMAHGIRNLKVLFRFMETVQNSVSILYN